MQTETSTNKIVDPQFSASGSIDGNTVFPTTSDYGSFYGATPIQRPAGAAQALVTDSSGGSASPTSGIQALTSGYSSAILGNAIATLAAQGNAMQAVLVSLGLMKGSA